MALVRPSLAAASVRAMITNAESVLPATAALMRATISVAETSCLPGKLAAALCGNLIFNVDAGRAGLYHFANGAFRVCPTSIRID